ncbi:MAG: hypothetical protein KKC66_03405 [Candidatus Omnitrophica bacterium]|nr:hypothetical protein [Candidatus Omnitrophota bacterium]
MRELVFKNLTSLDKKRRDLLISETVEKNGIKTITKRHSVYIIGNRKKVCNDESLFLENILPSNYDKRHVFIYKKKNTKQGKDSFTCDVVGKFCAVVRDEVYSIAFKHTFEVDFVATNPR